MKIKKPAYLLLMLCIYVFSFAACFFLTKLLHIENIILSVFIWDVFSTILIFAFSLITNNSSTYDPYWSIVPPIVALYLMIIYNSFSVMHILVFAAILFWSLRLTINWAIGTTGFSYEDWRYKMFRDKSRNWFEWFIYNFFGIHLVPTIFVFLGMLPFFDIFRNDLNYFTIIGVVIIVLGTLLELFADKDMHHFLKTTTEKKVCNYGLWKYSRHPNYLGEILIWVGTFVAMICNTYTHFYFAIGFITMIFMFNVISIPMMEKRQISRRSDYKDYIKTTHRILIFPNKKQKQ